jgi:phage regulator Rha-like protein
MGLTALRQEIESARLKMLEARQALEDHEHLKGHASSTEHQRLCDVFRKAALKYLKLSDTQR